MDINNAKFIILLDTDQIIFDDDDEGDDGLFDIGILQRWCAGSGFVDDIFCYY